jgi:hypothetical protein
MTINMLEILKMIPPTRQNPMFDIDASDRFLGKLPIDSDDRFPRVKAKMIEASSKPRL